MLVELYDGNNVFQRYLANDISGMPLRNFVNHVLSRLNDVHPVVVWDGKGAVQTRRGILPEYKTQRESKGEDFYAAMRLLKNALNYVPCIQVEVPGYEADDVIATLCYDDELQIGHIYTNDEDLSGLGPSTDGKQPSVPPRWLRLYKATVGDPSDNVKGIRGFGQAQFNALSDQEKQMIETKLDNRESLLPLKLFKPSIQNWLSENYEQLIACWQVVGFFDLDEETIIDNTVVGVKNHRKLDEILGHYEV